MSSDLAIRVSGLSKRYSIRRKGHDHNTLAQSVLHRLRHPRSGASREDFWALREVDLDIPRGAVLGVIGHNGAGKSTLLKVLSRITPPTLGRLEVHGRVGSLLEVGTGFHPELTGRENVYLNGAILGMKKREIQRQFEAIVDFSGVAQFLDTPVKRYSSGMYVRLAFAVAAHLQTEILLLDEVLAVGDPDFQHRSVAQIRRLAADGRTVVFVSHNPDLVADLTTTAVALSKGTVVDQGPTMEVLHRQYAQAARAAKFHREPGFGTHTRFIEVQGEADRSDDGLVRFRCHIRVASDLGCYGWRPNFTLHGPQGAPIGSTFGPVCPGFSAGGAATDVIVSEGLRLAPGIYSIDMSLSTVDPRDGTVDMVDLVRDACVFTVPNLRDGTWPPDWGALNFHTHRGSTSVETVEVSLPSSAMPVGKVNGGQAVKQK